MPKSKGKRNRIALRQYGVRINGVLIRKSFASASEARKWQASQKRVQDEIRAGTKRHLEPTLLSVHAPEFLEARKEMASYGSQAAWMGKYVLARPEFKDKYLHEITKGMWKEIFGKKGELVAEFDLAAATHNRIRSMIHKMYEDARKEYEPPRALDNPVHDIEPLPEPRKKLQILADRDEIAEYIAAAKEDRLQSWWIYVAIKLNTGLRQQNIIPLRWRHWQDDHFDVKEKFVRSTAFTGFRPGSKSDADERLSPVNKALAKALEAWRNVTPFAADDDFIVCTPEGGHLSPRTIWDVHKRTLERAELPYMSEHKLRHTYATHYLAAGGSIHDLKQNLFHSTVTTTEIYSHALKSEISRRGSVFQVNAGAAPLPEDDQND